VISPYAKRNFVDHAVTDQTSILRFIEDNWLFGTRIRAGWWALLTAADSLRRVPHLAWTVDEAGGRWVGSLPEQGGEGGSSGGA
jgi:hypothetical protein